MPAAEGLSAFTFVFSYVMKTRPPIQTGAGGTGVWLTYKKTYTMRIITGNNNNNHLICVLSSMWPNTNYTMTGK